MDVENKRVLPKVIETPGFETMPRRIRIDLLEPEEKAIWDLVGVIEELGAHPLLTDVVVLLQEARLKLADWFELPK